MKILIANKFYYRRGGDCIYALNVEEMLRRKGHEVAIFAMDYPDNLPSKWSGYFPSQVSFRPGPGMIEAFRRPLGTSEVKSKFSALLDDFSPDVVHLNNIHSYLSPIIAETAKNRGIRVVWTLHDYKLFCPRYDCKFKGGDKMCESCMTDIRNVLRNRCMKNSLVASWLAYREAKKWNRDRLCSLTDRFICPSRFMADKMEAAGFDKSKLVHLCNFIDTEKCHLDDYSKGDYYCYVGRLSHEKGIRTLMEAARRLPYKLRIVGSGPLEEELKSDAPSNIRFEGHKNWNEIKGIVSKARFIVIPSEWYENNPLSVIEASCLGTPVLGAEIGGIPELIDSEFNGMTFIPRSADDLAAKIDIMFKRVFDYQSIAGISLQKYDSANYYKHLIQIYQ